MATKTIEPPTATQDGIHLTCSQTEFNNFLSLVCRAVPTRPSHPVLANVLLEANAEDQMLSLTAFDLSIGIKVKFSAMIMSAGIITLPAKLLSDIVSRLPDGNLSLEFEGTLGTLTCGSSRYQLNGMSADEYPGLDKAEQEPVLLPRDAIANGIRYTLFSASDDASKQVLTGVHLTLITDAIEWASTDGHRLSKMTCNLEEEIGAQSFNEATIPEKALSLLDKILTMGDDEQVSLSMNRGVAEFHVNDITLICRLLEGQYPNYNQLIPKAFSRSIVVERKPLLAALERVAVMADQKNNIVKLTIADEQQSVVLTVDAADVGSAREELPAQVSGGDLEIAFNIKYMIEPLKAIAASEVKLNFNQPTNPSVMEPLDGSGYKGLTMPVQIRS